MTSPGWLLRIKVRERLGDARAYRTRNGCEIRLGPNGPPIASGRSRDEAWRRAWDALDEMETHHE